MDRATSLWSPPAVQQRVTQQRAHRQRYPCHTSAVCPRCLLMRELRGRGCEWRNWGWDQHIPGALPGGGSPSVGRDAEDWVAEGRGAVSQAGRRVRAADR